MPKEDVKEETISENSAANISAGDSIAEGQDNFEIIFSWETVDFIKNPRNKFFLKVAIIGSCGMIIWGILTGALTVIFTFIMLAAVSFMVLKEEPQITKVRIDENGVDLNDEHFDFKDFVSFSIAEMHGLPVLNLNRREKYFPAKTLYVEEEPVDDLRDFLKIFLQEEVV